MGYFEMIYRSEHSHRARAVYMYLNDQGDQDGQAGERKPQFQSVPAPLSIETDSPAKGRVRAFCEPSLGP